MFSIQDITKMLYHQLCQKLYVLINTCHPMLLLKSKQFPAECNTCLKETVRNKNKREIMCAVIRIAKFTNWLEIVAVTNQQLEWRSGTQQPMDIM